LIFSLAQKVLADFKLDYRLEKTLSLDDALRDADFVILTITTGSDTRGRRSPTPSISRKSRRSTCLSWRNWPRSLAPLASRTCAPGFAMNW